jgi:IstB-like ATP binding protein
MLLTSNTSVGEWDTVFSGPVVATAILDWLLHHSHVITIWGDSYRLKSVTSAAIASGAAPPPKAGARSESRRSRCASIDGSTGFGHNAGRTRFR